MQIPRGSNNRYSVDFKNSIVTLHLTGRSANSLAKEYNVSVSTVTKWVKQVEQELCDNILNQRFDLPTRPNQVWLSDSTEVRYGINGEYKMRLCGVLDLYGRYLFDHYNQKRSISTITSTLIWTVKLFH